MDLASEGVAIAKLKLEEGSDKELVIFVEQAVPGDVVDIKITRKQKNFMQGYVTKFHKYSNLRITPECQHFGTCGGCKWQCLPYPVQLKYKRKQVIDQIRHIGRLEIPESCEIIGSEDEFYYRNKLEFTFSDKRWLENEELNDPEKDLNGLGFHIPGKFDKVLDIKKCHLQGGKSNEIRLTAKQIANELGLGFFDLKVQEGFLRNLIIRNSATTNDLMVIVSFFSDDKKNRENFLDKLSAKIPEITSLMYVINPKRNDTISDLPIFQYKGNDHIIEEMEGLRFKIGPKSFYQTNSKQAYKLYCITREFASLKGTETVYDLYTGTGTIANFVAKFSAKVIGIEYIPDAIEDARENSRINNIHNTSFFAGDIKDILNDEFMKINGQPDVIIMDPPRAGLHKNVIESILSTNADRIVYVSCNAATQARDINLLSEKYRIDKIQPVDMFPQTTHVENVVLLTKKYN